MVAKKTYDIERFFQALGDNTRLRLLNLMDDGAAFGATDPFSAGFRGRTSDLKPSFRLFAAAI